MDVDEIHGNSNNDRNDKNDDKGWHHDAHHWQGFAGSRCYDKFAVGWKHGNIGYELHDHGNDKVGKNCSKDTVSGVELSQTYASQYNAGTGNAANNTVDQHKCTVLDQTNPHFLLELSIDQSQGK